MSFGTIANYNVTAAMQGNNSTGTTSGKSAQTAQLQAAFDTQMRMTQSLFGEGSQERGEGRAPGGFDTSLMGDAMMYEALTTISRLMRSEAGLPQQRAVSNPITQSQQVPVSSLLADTPEMGALSARFESGSGGGATIGYDRVGGTSYGKYQIASKPGTMDRFIAYLGENAPALGERLSNAGSANTGSKDGAMPTAWKEIAKEDPAGFEKLQHDFIAKETYDPARNMILKQTGLDFNNAPSALREVLWSTSVQHGPTGASKIFSKVIDRFVGSVDKGEFNAKLIEGVYDSRKGQFGSSTKRVQQSVANRLNAERQIALNMLGETKLNRIV